MQDSRIVVLDCETSTIHSGREPVCRYYMQQSGKTVNNEMVCEELNVILGIVFTNMPTREEYTHEWLKIKMTSLQKTAFNKHSFDDGFTIFWTSLQKLQYFSDSPSHADAFKDEFTKRALQDLSTRMTWKFIRKGQKDHFYYDEPVDGEYKYAADTQIIDFDIENKEHRDEVVRVCFGPHILSIGILQFDIPGNELQIVGGPYYQEFRQTPHYVHSAFVQKIHHLTQEQLEKSHCDISSLHTELRSIIKTNKNVTFVAHNAQQDRKWILDSIDDQVKYHEYLYCKNGSDQQSHIKSLKTLKENLKNEWSRTSKIERKWFCTLYGSMKDDGTSHRSQNGAIGKFSPKPAIYKLAALYTFITEREMADNHNALQDTYACALIFCRLLKISYHKDKIEESDGYKRILVYVQNVQKDRKRKAPKTLSLKEFGRQDAQVIICRQFDMYIDDVLLPPTFLTDYNTQVGEENHMEFGGGVGTSDLNNIVTLITNSEPRQHRLHEGRSSVCGNLGGDRLSFKLKQDGSDRRIVFCVSDETSSGPFEGALWWAKAGRNFRRLTSRMHRLEWNQIYIFREDNTDEQMSLKVVDLRPIAPIQTGIAGLPSSRTTLLALLKSLCL